MVLANLRSVVAKLRTALEPSPARLGLAATALAVCDVASESAGGSTFPGGPLDEVAHLLTTLLVVWALGRSARARFLLPALVGAIAIDLDHIPARLGTQWLTAGTPRPYTHSLLLIGVLLMGGGIWRRRRDVMVGLAVGVAIHFFRDLSEPASGVSLLWPFSDRAFSFPHFVYGLVMVVVVAADAWLLARPRRLAEKVGVLSR